MSIIADLAAGAANGAFTGLGNLAKDIRTAITGEEAMTAEQKSTLIANTYNLEIAALNADVAIAQGQVAINTEEAKSTSFFKSGWRPAVGWICASGLAYEFIVRPLLPWGVKNIPAMFNYSVTITPLPPLDMGTLLTLLMGLLGLGGMRTFEKLKGVSK